MDKKHIFKDFFIYSAGNYISQALGIASGFLLRAFLTPYSMGIWQGLNVIKSYASYTNLGVSRSAAREIAYFRGKKDEARGEILKNVGYSFSLLMSALVGAGCIVFALIRKPYINNYIFWGLISIGIIVILERLESYIVTILRSKKKFFAESVGKVCSSILNLALIIFVVRHFKLFGLYASHIMIFSCTIPLLISLSREHFRFVIRKKELKHLVKIGIPLVLMGFMFVSLTNIDRIVILKMIGAEKLGLYSIAIMMGNAVSNIANMISIVIYPRFQEIYGRSGSKTEVYTVMIKILKSLWFPLIVLVAGAVIFAPYLIKIFIPKYIGGIKAMKIFLCGIYFLSMAKFCNNFLVTVNKQVLSLIICITALLVNLILNINFINMGFDIEGVAAATGISYILYFILMFGTSVYSGTVKARLGL